MAKGSEHKMSAMPNLADRLNAALEASRQNLTNLNEALVANIRKREEPPPTEEVPERACPDANKSA